MKTYLVAKKRGSVLVMVMVIMITLTLMVAALLQLGSFNQLETVQQLRSTQAHWLAEAGLERGLSRVVGSKTYRAFLPNNFSNDETLLGGLGSYQVDITRTQDPTNSQIYTYTITSTGMASNSAVAATDAVRVRFRGTSGPPGPLLGLGGTSKIQNSTVVGNIYQEPPGELAFKGGNNSVTNGIIDAKGGAPGIPSGVIEGTLDPGPPTLNITPYSNAMLYAVSHYTNVDLTINSATDLTNNWVNGTNFVNGTLTINSAIPANRTLVANGSVTINGDIGTGVKIVARGDVSFPNHVTLQDQVQIFTLANINIGNHGVTGTETTLMAIGNITSANHLDLTGIIYAQGTVTLQTQATVTGTIIAGLGFDIKNATVTYDRSVFANPCPIDFGNGLVILPSSSGSSSWQWEESPF